MVGWASRQRRGTGNVGEGADWHMYVGTLIPSRVSAVRTPLVDFHLTACVEYTYTEERFWALSDDTYSYQGDLRGLAPQTITKSGVSGRRPTSRAFITFIRLENPVRR